MCAWSPRSANTIRHGAGFVVIFTIEEGEQYRFGSVDVQSSMRVRSIPALLRPKVRTLSGDVYNAEAVEKTVEEMTIEAAKQGYRIRHGATARGAR